MMVANKLKQLGLLDGTGKSIRHALLIACCFLIIAVIEARAGETTFDYAINKIKAAKDPASKELLPHYMQVYVQCNRSKPLDIDYSVCKEEDLYRNQALNICKTTKNETCEFLLNFIFAYSKNNFQGICSEAVEPAKRAFELVQRDLDWSTVGDVYQFFGGQSVNFRDRTSGLLQVILACVGDVDSVKRIEAIRPIKHKRWSFDHAAWATFNQALRNANVSEARIALSGLTKEQQILFGGEVFTLDGDYEGAVQWMSDRLGAVPDVIYSDHMSSPLEIFMYGKYLHRAGHLAKSKQLFRAVCNQGLKWQKYTSPRMAGLTTLHACGLMALFERSILKPAPFCNRIRKYFSKIIRFSGKFSFSEIYSLLGLASLNACDHAGAGLSVDERLKLIQRAEASYVGGGINRQLSGVMDFYEISAHLRIRLLVEDGQNKEAELELQQYIRKKLETPNVSSIAKLFTATRLVQEKLSFDDTPLSRQSIKLLSKLIGVVEEDIAEGVYSVGILPDINATKLLEMLHEISRRLTDENALGRIGILAFRVTQIRDLLRAGSSYDVLRALDRGGTAAERAAVKKISKIREKLQFIERLSRLNKDGTLSGGRPQLVSKLREVVRSAFPDENRSRKLLAPQPVSIEQLMEKLGPEKAVIISHCGTSRDYLYVFYLSQRGLKWKRSEKTCGEVRDFVAKVRSSVKFKDGLKFNRDVYLALSGAVLSRLEISKQHVHELIFILDDALTSLPPQMLLSVQGTNVNDPLPWLIKDYAISVAPSIEALVGLSKPRKPRSKDNLYRSFADPLFGNTPPSDHERGAQPTAGLLPQLPETALEAKRIANMLGEASGKLYLRDKATETKVKQEDLTNIKILHFATHALLAGEAAKYFKLGPDPAIALTVPQKSSDVDDGFLTASEISALDLSADLVVLSACNTGAGDGKGGAGLTGLARAFMHAGASGLIISHWPVASDATAELIIEFFRAYKEGRLSPSKALRVAMLKLLADGAKSADKIREHPAFWAPFVIVRQLSGAK
ncbi:CHAT domain-containing protein [Alphaproteobacteria bacterium]|nr:CHAT domain-containing protein [Alphaproteobacteria bacterium]